MWEETELKDIQALHDVNTPLAGLGDVPRKAALKEIVKQIKNAIFS